MASNVLNIKISVVENKIPYTSSLMTTTVLNTKIQKVRNNISDHAKYIITKKLII